MKISFKRTEALGQDPGHIEPQHAVPPSHLSASHPARFSTSDSRIALACESAIAHMRHLQAGSTDTKEGEQDSRHHGEAHDERKLDKVLKKMLGLSELDDPPHAILGVKSTFIGLHAGGGDHPASLATFASSATPHSQADMIADVVLSGFVGGVGVIAFLAGRMDTRNAGKEKVSLLLKKNALEEKKQAFLNFLQDLPCPEIGLPGNMRAAAMLKNQVAIMEWELERLDSRLGHNKTQKKVGEGSCAVGLASMIKGAIDIVCKPLAFLHVAGAGAAAGIAAIPLAPAAAGAGLYMGVQSKKLSAAKLKEFKHALRAAVDELGLKESALPEDIREDYRRFFSGGKWKSREEELVSYDRLMSWFVGGMAGYTAAMTGIAVAGLVSLFVTGGIIAGLALSSGVLAAVAVVMIGTYGFLRYREKIHQHEEHAGFNNREFDRDFMLHLAAQGGVDGILQPVRLLRMIEAKDDRRIDFLHELATGERLVYEGVKARTTDVPTIRSKRKTQAQAAGKNAAQRFLAARGMDFRKESAFGRVAGVLTPARLANLLRSPRAYAQEVDYMLQAVDDQLAYLDYRIGKKIDMYDMGDDSLPVSAVPVPPEVPAKDTDDGNRSARTKTSGFLGKAWLRTARRKVPEERQALPPGQHIRNHFRDIGIQLLFDRKLFEQGRALRERLVQWKKTPVTDRIGMADLQSRFLALHQWEVHDSRTGYDKPVEERWADYLLNEAPKRYREVLHATVVDVAPLRKAASLLSAKPEATSHARGWEWYWAETGAPQIGGVPAHFGKPLFAV